MQFEETTVLLPCHSLEDFPVHHQGAEAEGLLAAWSALWHPVLIAETGKLPTWYRADAPPEEPSRRIIVVPEVSESLLLAGWTDRVASEGSRVIRHTTGRDEIVAAALADHAGPEVDPDFVADFLALGTGYLMIELLTRQMRYMSNIDEIHLRNQTVAAAQAVVAGNLDEAKDRLSRSFDVLVTARERFYPVEAYLIDLVLVASSTVGESLRTELASTAPKNLLISGETLQRLADDGPETLAALRQALEMETASIVGGEHTERELPLLPLDSVLAEFTRGLATYERFLDRRPRVYGRRRYGLSPVLPQILSRMGYEGALHITLDDGNFPSSPQCKTRWEGLDSSAVDILNRVPCDANLPETYLSLHQTMGESMDHDHVATVILAHWPGQASPFLQDLRRMANYGPVLGKFVTLDYYFDQTERPGDLTKFQPDQYRAPYLRQAIIRQQPDALSRFARHHARHRRAVGLQTLSLFADLLDNTATSAPFDALIDEVDTAEWLGSSEASPQRTAGKLDQELTDHTLVATRRLAEAVARGAETTIAGCFVANPESFTRHVTVDVSVFPTQPVIAGPVLAVQESGSAKLALVEVPACGFAWLRPGITGWGAPITPPKKKGPPPAAEGHTLRNEIMEVNVDPTTGGLRSIYAPGARGNRLSQQLAFRLPGKAPQVGEVWKDPDLEPAYSVMAADSVEVTCAGPGYGEITSRGRLLDLDGKRLAGFTQTYRLWRGSRVLSIDVELDIEEIPRADPWNSYYAARFAWPDAGAELRRDVALASETTTAKRLEAPQFVEIINENARVTILTGGLPYHRYNGLRMLDTMLVVRGESQRRFRLAVAIDEPHAAQEAWDLLSPVSPLIDVAVPAQENGSSWLFHLDRPNVVATRWLPVVEEGKTVGFRVRLLETEGLPGRVHLRTLRLAASARQIDFQGQTLVELPVDADRIAVDLAAFEWAEVEAALSP